MRLVRQAGAVLTLAWITSAGPCGTPDTISWTVDCATMGYAPPLECAFVKVPLDWANCGAGLATLAVGRLNATKSPRLGSIFINPGGPGGSGLGYLNQSGVPVMTSTGGHHDLISWDPRGVGNSLPLVACNVGALQGALYVNNSIILDGPQYQGNFTNPQHNDPDEIAFMKQVYVADAQLEAVVAGCVAAVGDNLKYVGSVATVRDMVRLADMVDGVGKTVNFWGISYGSIIGEYFANIFPHRVGKVIIDGVLNPKYWAVYPRYLLLPYAFQKADSVYAKFLESCAAAPGACALASTNSTSASIDAYIQGLLDDAFKNWNASNPNSIRSSDLRDEIFGGMSGPAGWPQFAQTLLSLRGAVGPSNGFRKRKRDVIPTSEYSFSTEAISCSDAADNHGTTTKDVFELIVYAASHSSQKFGTLWDPGYWCHKWPVRAVERYAGPWNAKTKQPLLVVTNTNDPITPMVGAEAVASWMGSSAVLLTRAGYGHTSISSFSACTDAVMAAFFVNGTYPAKGTVCSTDEDYFATFPAS